jgi:SAM-dependent methyltransferase
MMILDENYWSDRYKSGRTGWNIGFASYPILQYLDQIENKGLEMLFPGAGNAYEVEAAIKSGFSSVHLLDYAEVPIQNFSLRNPEFPKSFIHLENFFEHGGKYDLIIEQTFFCALDPKMRIDYMIKMKSLLRPGAKLAGVLFDRNFGFQGPPFGGVRKEYQELFEQYFEIEILSPCYNSIPERLGSELFFILKNSKV